MATWPASDDQWQHLGGSQDYLSALASGEAFATATVEHRGLAIFLIAALRPDGKTLVTAESVLPASGKTRTEFWLVSEPTRAQALQHGISEIRRLLDDFLDQLRTAPGGIAVPSWPQVTAQ